jgi:hypothetical protein
MVEVEHSYRKTAILKQFDALQFSTVARGEGKGRAPGEEGGGEPERGRRGGELSGRQWLRRLVSSNRRSALGARASRPQ